MVYRVDTKSYFRVGMQYPDMIALQCKTSLCTTTVKVNFVIGNTPISIRHK